MPIINRRAFLEMAAAMGATAVCSKTFASGSRVQWQERRDLFSEGVASGDPDSHSVLLWTRCPQPRQDSTLRLTVEVSEDDSFRHVVATTVAPISAVSDWTCRVLVGGLQPSRVYWYRFATSEGLGSRIGRTISAPAVDDAKPARFAFVSCQNANQGAQNAYRRMIFEDRRAPEAERLAFVLHLGDFICATRTAKKSATFTFQPLSRTIAPFIELISATRIFRMHARAGPSSICGTITSSAGSAGNLCRNLKGRRGPRRPAKWPPIRRFLNISRHACRSPVVLP